MSATFQKSETSSRGARMLRTSLGPAIARFLEEPGIVEVMLNPDGRLWGDRLSEGLIDTGELVAPADGERIIRLVAHHVGAEVHAGSPRVSAELPETGERFEGLLPPVVTAPSSRNNGAKPRKVKLTRTQLSLAKRLGLTPEQYANQLVKEAQ